jgi:hypothetical protein
MYFRHGLKDYPKFFSRVRDLIWIRLHFLQLLFCVEEASELAWADSARAVRNGRDAFESNSIKVTFNTRAAKSGEIVATFLVFPAVSGLAAEPPPTAEPLAAEPLTATEPLSLLQWLRFEGLTRTVADPDMILEGGEYVDSICRCNLEN